MRRSNSTRKSTERKSGGAHERVTSSGKREVLIEFGENQNLGWVRLEDDDDEPETERRAKKLWSCWPTCIRYNWQDCGIILILLLLTLLTVAILVGAIDVDSIVRRETMLQDLLELRDFASQRGFLRASPFFFSFPPPPPQTCEFDNSAERAIKARARPPDPRRLQRARHAAAEAVAPRRPVVRNRAHRPRSRPSPARGAGSATAPT